MTERTLKAILIALGVFALAQALWMIVSPGTFFDAIAGFGTQNDHYIRDNATFQLAAGVMLLVAVNHASWRVPALTVVALWYAAHAVNHLVDIGESDPAWVGPADFGALAFGAVFFGYLAYGVSKGRIGRPAGG